LRGSSSQNRLLNFQGNLHGADPSKIVFQQPARLESFQDRVRDEVGRFRGREVDTAGDGFFATFDGPARAIRCAQSIRDAVAALGLVVRTGLHTGECEVSGEKVAGIAVHVGARVAAAAAPGEILVSGTVKDLVAGSGLRFEDRGARELRACPGCGGSMRSPAEPDLQTRGTDGLLAPNVRPRRPAQAPLRELPKTEKS
jgi:hypothetical protein